MQTNCGAKYCILILYMAIYVCIGEGYVKDMEQCDHAKTTGVWSSDHYKPYTGYMFWARLALIGSQCHTGTQQEEVVPR